MIPKTEILALAKNYSIQPNTIQKDYIIGWLLRSISQHSFLSKWVFKGGTCLKKCYFETYRFSEDLDFTVPSEESISVDLIIKYLEESVSWIEENSGIIFPRRDWKMEAYTNPYGNTSFQGKISYRGPLGGAPKSLPRIKFDITQDELIADIPQHRNLYHNFSDEFQPLNQVLCYSLNEVLAEKSRALVQRSGRARDVYDVVNISRNFREQIDALKVKEIAFKKFDFKDLEPPSVERIMSAIDLDALKANWKHQLAHQITILPPIETYFNDLEDSIAWWLDPKTARPTLRSMPQAKGNLVPRPLYPEINWKKGLTVMDQIRYAARNHLCAIVQYHGAKRLVEPYSLRYPTTGNEILHVWEVEINDETSNAHKSFNIGEIESVFISERSFMPKWKVEL